MDEKNKGDKPKQAGLGCPECGCEDLPVDDTVRINNIIRRRRHCRYCGRRIVTVERRAGGK